MRIAVIGTGFGERVVAPLWRRLGCEADVLSPRDREGIARACGSGVDLVSVHSPPFLHYEHVMLALDHGRHVLCDKPFGRNAAEALAMRDRARHMGVLHFLNFEFRRHPGRAKAKELLDAGAIGALRHINWTFIGNGLRPQKFRWLFDKDQSGGWIGAYGSHAIDAIRYFFASEVAQCGGLKRTETRERVDASGATRAATAEDAFSGWFAMDNGGTASLDTAFSTAISLPQRVHLLGSDGAIEIVNDLRVSLLRPGQGAESFTYPPSEWDTHEPALLPWLGAVLRALDSGRQIAPNFDDGLAVAQVMERLRRDMTDIKPVGAE